MKPHTSVTQDGYFIKAAVLAITAEALEGVLMAIEALKKNPQPNDILSLYGQPILNKDMTMAITGCPTTVRMLKDCGCEVLDTPETYPCVILTTAFAVPSDVTAEAFFGLCAKIEEDPFVDDITGNKGVPHLDRNTNLVYTGSQKTVELLQKLGCIMQTEPYLVHARD